MAVGSGDSFFILLFPAMVSLHGELGREQPDNPFVPFGARDSQRIRRIRLSYPCSNPFQSCSNYTDNTETKGELPEVSQGKNCLGRADYHDL